jgi:hypothetical protein
MSVPETGATYQASFERIEAAVAAGETDLRRLGFWKLVAGVKRDRVLAEHWADIVGRIDRRAFETAVRFRLPVWLGNAVLAVGTLAGAFLVGFAVGTDQAVQAGIALVLAGGVWSVAWHDLAHWVVGRAVGIRFTCYFVGGPFPPRPGLKSDYATYLRTSPRSRAWMHASGAIATKLAPFVVLALWPASGAPWWAAVTLLALGLLQIVTDVLFSVRSSDWKKVRRELRVARDQDPA